jgi:hypothetical protein
VLALDWLTAGMNGWLERSGETRPNASGENSATIRSVSDSFGGRRNGQTHSDHPCHLRQFRWWRSVYGFAVETRGFLHTHFQPPSCS